MVTNKKHRFVSLFGSLFLLSVLFLGLGFRQEVDDWLRLRDYTPPKIISDLASATTMNELGRKLFYVYEPVLNDKTTFNENCEDSEKSVVLGCYVSKAGIYIFDISDERLSGIEEVTAAHEMLHVAYERLSNDKDWIDNMVTNAYKSVKSERIRKTIEQYKAKDSKVVSNELHSILATEVRNLPKDLESYYRRFFTNRKAIVDLAERYEAAFAEREAKIQSYDDQLAKLKSQIDASDAKLDKLKDQLQSEKTRMDELLKNKQIQEYNQAVPGYNNLVRSYNSLAGNTRALIEQYNQIVANRNATASEENELIKAIDSRPENIQL
ncbi:MAG: hypothetical protein AAB459_01420 [Patescibacteria group bacterium]